MKSPSPTATRRIAASIGMAAALLAAAPVADAMAEDSPADAASGTTAADSGTADNPDTADTPRSTDPSSSSGGTGTGTDNSSPTSDDGELSPDTTIGGETTPAPESVGVDTSNPEPQEPPNGEQLSAPALSSTPDDSDTVTTDSAPPAEQTASSEPAPAPVAPPATPPTSEPMTESTPAAAEPAIDSDTTATNRETTPTQSAAEIDSVVAEGISSIPVDTDAWLTDSEIDALQSLGDNPATLSPSEPEDSTIAPTDDLPLGAGLLFASQSATAGAVFTRRRDTDIAAAAAAEDGPLTADQTSLLVEPMAAIPPAADFWDPSDPDLAYVTAEGYLMPASEDAEGNPQFATQTPQTTAPQLDVDVVATGFGTRQVTVTNTGGRDIYVLQGSNGEWTSGTTLAPGQSQVFTMTATGINGPTPGTYPDDMYPPMGGDYGESVLLIQGERESDTGNIVMLGAVGLGVTTDITSDEAAGTYTVTRAEIFNANIPPDDTDVDWQGTDPTNLFLDPGDVDWPRTVAENNAMNATVVSLDGAEDGVAYEYFDAEDPDGQRIVLHNDGDTPIAVTIVERNENGHLTPSGFLVAQPGTQLTLPIDPQQAPNGYVFEVQGVRVNGAPATYGLMSVINGDHSANGSTIPEWTPPEPGENHAPELTVTPGSSPYTWSATATDADGDPLDYDVTDGQHGTVTFVNGQAVYTPHENVEHAAAAPGGPTVDQFTITASDGTDSDTEIITVTITPTNTGPSGSLTPGATDPASGSVIYTVATTDGDGDTVTTSVAAAPAHGTLVKNTDGTYTYTPDPVHRHQQGYTDTFRILLDDGHGGVTPVDTTVNVAQYNRDPSIVLTPGSPDAVTGAVTYAVWTDDLDSDSVTTSIGTPPAHGVLVKNPDGSYTYTPDEADRLAGTFIDSFTIVADDGHGGSASAPAMLTVTQHVPTNQAPTLTLTAGTVDAVTGAVTYTVTTSDPDGDAVTTAIATQPTNGTLVKNGNGSYTYTPNQAKGKQGAFTDSFAIIATDSKGKSTSTTQSVSVRKLPSTQVQIAAARIQNVLTSIQSFVSSLFGGWFRV